LAQMQKSEISNTCHQIIGSFRLQKHLRHCWFLKETR